MKRDEDWPARLSRAVERLENTKTVPEWLREAVRDSLDVATELAPAGRDEPRSSDFFYPH